MQRQWYLIDDEGIHPVMPGGGESDFWNRFNNGGDDAPWPPFNQVVVKASPSRTVDALFRTGPAVGLALEEVTDDPSRWEGSLTVACAEEVTLIGEPGVDLDDARMAIPWAEELFADLRCDGIFFGYDDGARTLHMTRFRQGWCDFSWSDSLLPGPSYAMSFDDEGRCVTGDPRRVALKMLDMPETSPLLDRYHFVSHLVAQLGLTTIRPELLDLPVVAAIATRTLARSEHGEPR